MSKSTVIQDIKSKIRPNGKQNITGQVLQDVLVESVNLVPEKVSELVNDSQYQIKANLDTALATKADKSSLDSKQDKLVSGTNIKTINGVPVLGSGDIKTPAQTKVSELENDKGFLTEHQSLEAYYQKAAAQLDNRVVAEAGVAALDAEVPEDEDAVSAEATEGRP